MDSIRKNFEKIGSSVFQLFDQLYVKIIIITILVIYNSGLFIDFNLQLSQIFNNTILRLIILIILVPISTKNITIALLLVLALAISSYYKQENFESDDQSTPIKEDDEDESAKQKVKKTKKKIDDYMLPSTPLGARKVDDSLLLAADRMSAKRVEQFDNKLFIKR